MPDKKPIPINPQTKSIIGAYVQQQREDAIQRDFDKAMATLKPEPSAKPGAQRPSKPSGGQ